MEKSGFLGFFRRCFSNRRLSGISCAGISTISERGILRRGLGGSGQETLGGVVSTLLNLSGMLGILRRRARTGSNNCLHVVKSRACVGYFDHASSKLTSGILIVDRIGLEHYFLCVSIVEVDLWTTLLLPTVTRFEPEVPQHLARVRWPVSCQYYVNLEFPSGRKSTRQIGSGALPKRAGSNPRSVLYMRVSTFQVSVVPTP